MIGIKRIRHWLQRARHRRAAEKATGPLREFIYLDDVSVHSLLASRRGPLATELTETETRSLLAEVDASVGASAPLAKAEVSSKASASQAQGTQVLRKVVVQASFKELYELELPNLLLRPASEYQASARRPSTDHLRAALAAGELTPWAIRASELMRGRLLELEVELEAEAVFQFSAVVSSLVSIVTENEKLFGRGAWSSIAEMGAVNRIIEELLVGLVPVRGKVVDYELLDINGQEWIVHREIADEIEPGARTRSLYVVGVAEHALFWKDIRRVLFSSLPFRILCRVNRPGIQSSWTPVKLADVLRGVAPGLAAQVQDAVRDAVEMIKSDDPEPSRGGQVGVLGARSALVRYAAELARHHGHVLQEGDLDDAGLLADVEAIDLSNLKQRREAFEPITTYVDDRFDTATDRLTAANLRAGALVERQPDAERGDVELPRTDSREPSEHYVDSEFVAMYW